MWPARCASGTLSPLPALVRFPPRHQEKLQRDPPCQWLQVCSSQGLLCFIQEQGLTFEENLAGGIRRRQLSAGLSGVLGVAPLSTCKGFLRWAQEPPRAASPGPCTHLDSVKQVGAHQLRSCTPISKPLRRTPSVCLPVIESLHSYFCTNMLGTLYKVHTQAF